MIIKKKKNNKNNNSESIKPENFNQEENAGLDVLDILSDVTERQERRRGDRRRGYRRIEDRGLVSRAHEEAKNIKDNAAKEGFESGLAHAQEQIEELQNAISSLLGVKEEAYEHYKEDIASIAIQVAQKILNAQVQINPETVVEIAENVIKEISAEDSKITFIINPADELVLKENLENNSAFKNKRATMSVQTNDEIERGSCKVITNSGQIDATFTSQLNIIKKAFEEGI